MIERMKNVMISVGVALGLLLLSAISYTTYDGQNSSFYDDKDFVIPLVSLVLCLILGLVNGFLYWKKKDNAVIKGVSNGLFLLFSITLFIGYFLLYENGKYPFKGIPLYFGIFISLGYFAYMLYSVIDFFVVKYFKHKELSFLFSFCILLVILLLSQLIMGFEKLIIDSNGDYIKSLNRVSFFQTPGALWFLIPLLSLLAGGIIQIVLVLVKKKNWIWQVVMDFLFGLCFCFLAFGYLIIWKNTGNEVIIKIRGFNLPLVLLVVIGVLFVKEIYIRTYRKDDENGFIQEEC